MKIRESLPNVRELEATGLVLMGWLIRMIPLVPETWIAVNPVKYNAVTITLCFPHHFYTVNLYLFYSIGSLYNL